MREDDDRNRENGGSGVGEVELMLKRYKSFLFETEELVWMKSKNKQKLSFY